MRNIATDRILLEI